MCTAVDESYQGPKLEGDLTPEFMKELLDWLKKERKLHRKYAYKVHTVIMFFVASPMRKITEKLHLPSALDHLISARDYEESAHTSGCGNT